MRASAIALSLLIAANAIGCNHTHVTAETNNGTIKFTPQSAAAESSNSSQLARAPVVVADAFRAAHPGATVQRVKARMAIDQSVHYFVSFTDSTSGRHEVEYGSDGSVVKGE